MGWRAWESGSKEEFHMLGHRNDGRDHEATQRQDLEVGKRETKEIHVGWPQFSGELGSKIKGELWIGHCGGCVRKPTQDEQRESEAGARAQLMLRSVNFW